MRDFITIGATPHGEDCAQVGSKDYDYTTRAKRECAAFKAQIMHHYPAPTDSDCYVSTKSFPHDFGTYHEVVAVFDTHDQAAIDWALSIEGDEKGVLEYWEPEFNPHKLVI